MNASLRRSVSRVLPSLYFIWPPSGHEGAKRKLHAGGRPTRRREERATDVRCVAIAVGSDGSAAGMTEWSSEPTEAQSGMTEWSSEERELPSDLSESPRDSATCRVHWSCLRAAPAIPRASARLGPTEQSITCRQGSVPCRRGRVPRGSSGRGFEGRGSDGDERGFAVDRDYSSRDARYSILHGRESAVGRERFMLARDRFVLARDGFVLARDRFVLTPAPFRLTTDQSYLDGRGFALDRKESDLTGTPFHVDVRSFQRTERRLRVDAREMCVYAHQRRLGKQRFHGARGALSLARAALSVDTGVFDRNRNASALIRRWCELDAPESLLDRRSFDRDGREFHLRRRELE